ncbi:MAG: DoxX family protein, partial [Bacteroidota bacterium]
TVLMCLLFLFSATMYFTKYEMVAGFFQTLGFPTWIIYPLAVAKVLAVVAILSNRSQLLKEWAYAGFFYDAVLATMAHYMAEHGAFGLSTLAIVLVIVSRMLDGARKEEEALI